LAQSNGVTVFDPGGGSGLLPGFLLFAPIAGLLGKRAHFRTTLLESVFLSPDYCHLLPCGMPPFVYFSHSSEDDG